MISMTRRSAFAAFAAALVAPIVARAQGATVGPAGGVASTTAPSNSAGTPAGGTGVISSTRVPARSTATAAASDAPLVGGNMGTSERKPRKTRRRHRSRHSTKPSQ